jgi:hypothetical protein
VRNSEKLRKKPLLQLEIALSALECFGPNKRMYGWFNQPFALEVASQWQTRFFFVLAKTA